MTKRYFIKRVPKVAEIIAAQQRRRQLFEDRESRPQHEPQFVADDGISWSAIIEAADRARLAEVAIWHVERGASNFTPERGLLVGSSPQMIGFDDD